MPRRNARAASSKSCCSCPGVEGEYVFWLRIAYLTRWIVSTHPSVLHLITFCRSTPVTCINRDQGDSLARKRGQAERCLQRWRRRAVRKSRHGPGAFVAYDIEGLSSIPVSCQSNTRHAGDEDMLMIWSVGSGWLRALPARFAARQLLRGMMLVYTLAVQTVSLLLYYRP